MLFVDSLTDAARRWAVPIEQGEWWDHPAMPFHVVLVGQREVLEQGFAEVEGSGRGVADRGGDRSQYMWQDRKYLTEKGDRGD